MPRVLIALASLVLAHSSLVALAGALDWERGPISTENAIWHVEPIADVPASDIFVRGSSPTDIVVDSRSIPHVLYCRLGEIRHAEREVSGWRDELIVPTPPYHGESCGHIAADALDGLHVAGFWSTTSPGFKYAFNLGSGWSYIDTDRRALDIKVDAQGRPHILDALQTPSESYTLRYATWTGSSWSFETIGDAGRPHPLWAELALGRSGAPHVLFYRWDLYEVRHAWSDAGGWHIETVENVGNLPYYGRQGSIAVTASGTVHAAYLAFTQPYQTLGTLRHATRTVQDWSIETVEAPPGMPGFWPTILTSPDGLPGIGYQRWGAPSSDRDVWFAAPNATGWALEKVYDSNAGVFYPSFAADPCGNPHAVFYSLDPPSGIYYATRGEPCGGRSVTLDLDPDTVNLKSKGKWVTAYVTAEGAAIDDIDADSLRLNGISAMWTRTVEGTLVAKFERAAFAATVQPGEAVVVTLSGKWEDGSAFAATDTIRVIRPVR